MILLSLSQPAQNILREILTIVFFDFCRFTAMVGEVYSDNPSVEFAAITADEVLRDKFIEDTGKGAHREG